jgi:hypothetical protein
VQFHGIQPHQSQGNTIRTPSEGVAASAVDIALGMSACLARVRSIGMLL